MNRKIRTNRSSAKRAIGVGLKPGVDALDVKRVFAIGQHTALFFVFELGQTDDAFKKCYRVVVTMMRSGGNGIDEGREGFDDGEI